MSTQARRLPLVDTSFADFQNDALLEKVEAHEEAAHEKRNWVRLTYDCNNRCTFCLDSNAHDGTIRGVDEVKIQIVMGRRKGAERLILSGGEPTMHPNFLDFVKIGKRAGYRKVQTVTNGRMFQYPEFLARAADYGLDEITFSLHGHTAKLHDALVGTPGAFEEESRGLRAALDSGRFIVNVDVVINKQNVRHLPEMLETFIGWGVREFDLLHVIPFGNAWSDARDHLFYDLDGNLPYLQRAFAYARRDDVHVWLNRFPPPYAEGFEDLIQDPYKLNDEVRGRREEYDRYLSHGEKLHCREPERCRRCYLEPLCDGLDRTLEARRAPEVDVLRVRAGSAPAHLLPRAKRTRLVASSADEALALSARYEGELELDLVVGDEPAPARETLRALTPDDEVGAALGPRLRRVYARSAELARALLEPSALGPGVELAIVLTKAVEPVLRERGELAEHVVLVQPSYDRVTLARERDVELRPLLDALGGAFCTEGVVSCLGGRPRAEGLVLDAAALGADGRVAMPAFTQRFVAEGFRTKALRCGGCAENARCPGVHVNWVRAHGFEPLAPIATS